MSKMIIPMQIVDKIRNYLEEHTNGKGIPDTLMGQCTDKLNILKEMLNIGDYYIYMASDDQLGFITKVNEHYTLEIIMPLIENSYDEFYYLYKDGKCQHNRTATIYEIAEEIKQLLNEHWHGQRENNQVVQR